jgi:carbon starvation protein CstA
MLGYFHKAAAQHITSRGLGLVPRIMLAVFAGLFAAVMFLTAPDNGVRASRATHRAGRRRDATTW